MGGMDPRILLVVEDGAMRERLEKLLRTLRYDVVPAASADEALASLRAPTPIDLVVMDLPVDAAQTLRREQLADPAIAKTPLLAIGEPGQLDADAHVPAPVDAFVLFEQLTRLRALARPPEQWRARDENAQGDEDLLPFLKQSLQTMVAGLPASVARVRELNADSATVEQLMQEAVRGGARVEAYLSYLNAFNTGGGSSAHEPLDVRKTIGAVLAVWASKLGQRAVVHRRLGEVPLVMARDELLSQLFFSLIINAAQAIPLGNALGNRVEVATFTDENGWAVAEVTDTGSGIPAELLTKIFEPFYSTKRGVGLGMGLFVVRNIVTMLRGRIAVQSEVGRGTTFRVSLPPASTVAP
jgi:signal transduction histidine kinase